MSTVHMCWECYNCIFFCVTDEQLSSCLSLEPLDYNFRMRVGSENTKKTKKDSLDIPIHSKSWFVNSCLQ